jgi:hypothetical protein
MDNTQAQNHLQKHRMKMLKPVHFLLKCICEERSMSLFAHSKTRPMREITDGPLETINLLGYGSDGAIGSRLPFGADG